MKTLINKEIAPVPISSDLITLVSKVITSKLLETNDLTDITINFTDDSYVPELGGYHPIEIRLVKVNKHWQFDYITDFCYVGNELNTELTKEIDFDFTNNVGFQLNSGHHNLADLSELFQLWQSNFIEYVEQQIFTISVSTS